MKARQIKYQVAAPAPNGVGTQTVDFFTLVGARALAKAYGVDKIRDLENNTYLPAEEPKVVDLHLIVSVLALDPLDINRSLPQHVVKEFHSICRRINDLKKANTIGMPLAACVQLAKVEWLKTQISTV